MASEFGHIRVVSKVLRRTTQTRTKLPARRSKDGVSRDLVRSGGGHAESLWCLLMVAREAEWGVLTFCALVWYALASLSVPSSNFGF